MNLYCCLSFVALLITAQPGYDIGAAREFQILRHNINQVEMCVSNYGKFGQDETGNNAGCWWPVGTNHTYIYGAGSWFGTVDVNGDSLVTIGFMTSGGACEFAPGCMGWSVNDPQAVIYMYPDIWPPYDPDRLPMAPQTSRSHQDSWCVYNDGDIQYHIAGDTRPIGIEVYQTVYAWNLSTMQDVIFIQFEVKNTTSDTLQHCYFGVCTDNDIGNEAGEGNDIISGIVGDTLIFGGDTFWVDDLGYQWQEVEEPGAPPWFPGAIGYDLLQTPFDLVDGEDKDNDSILDQYERDSTYFVNTLPASRWDIDRDGLPDWRDPSQIPQLGMTAFKRYTLNLSPNQDYERYTSLAGYDFRTGVYEPYDTVPPTPDDQRFLQCSGPFTLAPDSTVIVLVGIIFANWDTTMSARPDSALASVDVTAQYIFDQNWLLPGPPPPPTVTLLPGDTRITLVWDNIAETTPDPYWDVVGTDPTSPLYDQFYRQYDFEGYRIWRSLTGQTGTWDLLASYDMVNGILINDTTFAPEPLVANDNGVTHVFVDDNVRNGFVYYYSVTSFDYNAVTTIVGTNIFPTYLWFESGLGGDSVRARRDPANYVPPGEPVIEWVSGNEDIVELVDATVVYATDVDANYPLYIEYLAPDTATVFYLNANNNLIPYTGARYTALLKDDSGILDTISYVRAVGSGYLPYEVVPPVNGMFINPDIGTPELPSVFRVYDSLEIVTGTYPLSQLVTDLNVELPAAADSTDSTYMHGMWAWRGNDYQIVWRRSTPSSPVNTIEVTDLATGEIVPYRQYQNTPATRHLGNGWCFTFFVPTLGPPWTAPSHDTLQPAPTFTGTARTRYLYLNGGMVSLNGGLPVNDTLLPSDGETWILYANRDYLPASVFGTVRITGTPGVFTDTTMTLNVKVVPNPYIISNEWQTRFVQRRVKFINLPNRCTIRIFNLNGELVRTLKHHETSAGGLSNDLGGDEWWNVLNDYDQLVASGVYIFHIQSDVGEQVGKFVVID